MSKSPLQFPRGGWALWIIRLKSKHRSLISARTRCSFPTGKLTLIIMTWYCGFIHLLDPSTCRDPMASDEPLFRLALEILMATGALLLLNFHFHCPQLLYTRGCSQAKLKHLSAWSCRYRQPVWSQASYCFCSSQPIGTLVRELANSPEETAHITNCTQLDRRYFICCDPRWTTCTVPNEAESSLPSALLRNCKDNYLLIFCHISQEFLCLLHSLKLLIVFNYKNLCAFFSSYCLYPRSSSPCSNRQLHTSHSILANNSPKLPGYVFFKFKFDLQHLAGEASR